MVPYIIYPSLFFLFVFMIILAMDISDVRAKQRALNMSLGSLRRMHNDRAVDQHGENMRLDRRIDALDSQINDSAAGLKVHVETTSDTVRRMLEQQAKKRKASAKKPRK